MGFKKSTIRIDFLKRKTLAFVISVAMVLLSLSSFIFFRGLNYGVDFVGGTLIQIKFNLPVSINQVESALYNIDFDFSNLQSFGSDSNNEFLIKTTLPVKEDLSIKLNKIFSLDTELSAQIRRIETVGPKIGDNLRKKALTAVFYSLLLIFVYVSGRFEGRWFLSGIMAVFLGGTAHTLIFLNFSVITVVVFAIITSVLIFLLMKFKYATGAVIALLHDIIIIIGVFSFTGKELSVSIVAALLTTVGYSLNDTIIVYDRIRENVNKIKHASMNKIINVSINEVLVRTLLTSFTTMIVILSLLIFGGDIIYDFAFALAIGIVTGTYSSIYVAAPILLLSKDKKHIL